MRKTRFPAMALPADERRKMAASWADSAQWNVLAMNAGRAVEAQEGLARVTLRIFARGAPAHCLREVLQELGERTPERDLEAGASLLPGPWYHKASWWRRDDQGGGQDPTMTIFRILSDGPVTETNVVEDGCGSRTSIRFVFDASEVEDTADIEHSGEQGYSVRIGGVAKDPETGLYNYYVTVTERKTQYLPEDISSEDAFSTDYDASWLGLRGTADAPTDDAGEGVTVWDPAAQAAGTLASLNWSRNLEDCTLNAQGKKRVAKRGVAAAESCSRDLFGEQDTENVSGASAKLGHAPAAAAGKSYDYQSKLRPDGLFDTAKATKEEFSVTEAEVTDEVNVFEESQAVSARSQASDPDPASYGGGVIRTVQKSKTPGGRKNTRVVTVREKPVPASKVSKSADLFGTELAQTDANQAAVPADPAAASGGVTETVSTELTRGGLRNNQKSVRTELPVSSAEVSNEEDAFTITASSSDRSQASDPAPASYGGGTVRAVQKSKTPGGLKNTRVTIRTEKDVAEAAVSTSKTVFESEESVEEISLGAPTEAPAASGGVIVAKSGQLTPGGKHRKRTVTKVELPVPISEQSATGTQFQSELAATSTNVSAWLGAYGNTAQGVIQSSSAQLTPGGLAVVRGTVRTELPVPQSLLVKERLPWMTRISRTDTHTSNSSEVVAEGTSLRLEKTPGGLYNRTLTQAPEDIESGFILRHMKTGDAFNSVEEKQTVETSKTFSADNGLNRAGLAGAYIVLESFDAKEDGTFIKTWRKTTAKPEINFYKYDHYHYTVEERGEDVEYSVDAFHYNFRNATRAFVENLVALLLTTNTFTLDYQFGWNGFELSDGFVSYKVRTKVEPEA